MSDFEKNISSNYLRSVAEQMQDIKQLSYEHLHLQDAQRILDVGCGPGIDTVALAKLVHENAKVYGVDISEQMIREANEYALQHSVFENVEHIRANVLNMPFSNDFFDAVRAERLFQVLPQSEYYYQDVFNELHRIVRPNGRLVLVDTDWATASVDFENTVLERKFMRFFTDVCRPDGYAARRFYGLMKRARYRNIQVHIVPQIMYDIQQSPLGAWLTEEALNQDFATIQEVDDWMNILKQKSQKGEMFAVVNMIVVSGLKMN